MSRETVERLEFEYILAKSINLLDSYRSTKTVHISGLGLGE